LSTITLAVIAGGMGSRMGGPKALLRVDGQSMAAWLLDQISWPGPTMLGLAPSVPRPPDADQFDQVAVDPVDGLGPLRGILTMLEHATTTVVVAIAVDMPYVRRAQLAWLVDQLVRTPDRLGFMCRAMVDGECIVEPFPAALRREGRDAIERRLVAGRRSVHGLCEQDPRFASAAAPAGWPTAVWTNLNDREAFTAFESERGVKSKSRNEG
jgi:molybdopterin-guanine dinucleotide biosynthesis protein A